MVNLILAWKFSGPEYFLLLAQTVNGYFAHVINEEAEFGNYIIGCDLCMNALIFFFTKPDILFL